MAALRGGVLAERLDHHARWPRQGLASISPPEKRSGISGSAVPLAPGDVRRQLIDQSHMARSIDVCPGCLDRTIVPILFFSLGKSTQKVSG